MDLNLKGTKWSPIKIHCPIQKIKIKKSHYKAILILSAAAIWAVHEVEPHYEMHAAFLTNLLFALDPTA